MNVLDRLLALGFRETGSTKGFRVTGDVLELWISGDSPESSRQGLWEALKYCGEFSDEGPVMPCWQEQTSQNMVSLTFRVPGLTTDVWVVGDMAEESLFEKKRWERRGYRVQVVPCLENAPHPGLVVRLENDGKRGFSGYLPYHPLSGASVQSWH